MNLVTEAHFLGVLTEKQKTKKTSKNPEYCKKAYFGSFSSIKNTYLLVIAKKSIKLYKKIKFEPSAPSSSFILISPQKLKQLLCINHKTKHYVWVFQILYGVQCMVRQRYCCLDLVSNWLKKKNNCLLITIWKLSSFKVDNEINFFCFLI